MNRENTPTPFVVQGDVESQAGDKNITVTGIQRNPFADTPPDTGQIPVFGSDGVWHPEDPAVSGVDDEGTTPTVPPVQVGGIDEGNLVREIRLDTYGGIRSVNLENLLYLILLEIRAMKTAIINLDNTATDQDYVADKFSTIEKE